MKDKQIEVTVLWYKSNVVRLSLDGKKIWETDESALVNILCDDNSDTSNTHKTTAMLSIVEAIKYSAILLRGLQIKRLESLLILVKSKMIEFSDKVKRFEINQIIYKAIQDFDKSMQDLDNDDVQCDKRYCDNCSDAELDDAQDNIDNNSNDSDKDIRLDDDIIQR